MTSILLTILILFFIISVVFIGYKFFLNSKDISNDNISEQSEFVGYKKPISSDKNLVIENRLEYSWKFLYDISDKVLNFFSQEDQQEIYDTGRKLYEKGMKYEHVIDLAISAQANRSVEVAQKKASNQINM